MADFDKIEGLGKKLGEAFTEVNRFVKKNPQFEHLLKDVEIPLIHLKNKNLSKAKEHLEEMKKKVEQLGKEANIDAEQIKKDVEKWQ